MKRKTLKMKIIYEDEDVIVVDKPSGLITIKDEKTLFGSIGDTPITNHIMQRRNA